MSVQFSSGWYLCAQKSPCMHSTLSECLSEVSPMLPLKQFIVSLIGDAPLLSFQGRLSGTSSSHASLIQVIGDVMSLA